MNAIEAWIALECAAVCAWLYLLAARGGFWRFREPAPPHAEGGSATSH